MKRRFLFSGLLAVSLLLSAPPHSIAAQDPGAFINQLGTQGIQVLGPSVPPAQRAAVFRQLFQADFDVNGISQFVLGRHWRALTPQQQQEFLSLFQEYTVQAYANRLGQYGGAPFRVTGARPMGEEVVVTSEVVRQGGNPVRLDWHVTDQGGQYKITDVNVDGVSMKVTQRYEFASIIQRNNGRPDSILSVMRQQSAQAH